MAALSDNKSRKYRYIGRQIYKKSFIAGTSQTIYEGQMVALDANNRVISAVTTKQFLGIAANYALQGATIDSTIKVVVDCNQLEQLISPSTASVAMVGKIALVASGNAITIATATYTSQHAINKVGTIRDWESGYLWIEIDPNK